MTGVLGAKYQHYSDFFEIIATPRERRAKTPRVMNKRLAMLEKLTASGQVDSFAFYGLAMEYRKEGRVDDALRAFSDLQKQDAQYLPMYLMAGQTLREAGRKDEAVAWLKQGIAIATEKRDTKTLGELESELATAEG